MSTRWPLISALINDGGQIIIGQAKPLSNAAIAHDGSKPIVMLWREWGEELDLTLTRLEAAMETAGHSSDRRNQSH